MKCAGCLQKPVHKCYSEGFDCTGGLARPPQYREDYVRRMLTVSSEIEARHYMQLTRLEEIMRSNIPKAFV